MGEIAREEIAAPSKQDQFGPFVALSLISVSCALATVVIAMIAATIINRWTTFDSSALFAVATMVACPAFLGVGASYFVFKTANSRPRGLDPLG